MHFDLTVTGNGDSFGSNGEDRANILEETMALGHYEQFVLNEGVLRVGDQEYPVNGGGLRDHSWGPRDWSGPLYYRWISVSFDDGLAIMGLEVAQPGGTFTRRAAIVSGGVASEAQLGDVTVDWTADGFCRTLSCSVKR